MPTAKEPAAASASPHPLAGTLHMANVPQTSLGVHVPPPGEVTVQFRRWHAMANTAYQRGQWAGFPPRIAADLIAARVADRVVQVAPPVPPAPVAATA